MTKIEKVIAGLQRCCIDECTQGSKCPYYSEKGCLTTLLYDALVLLKEREPVKPKEVKLWYTEYACGYCDYKSVGRKDGYKMRFCPCCGRAVKWND